MNRIARQDLVKGILGLCVAGLLHYVHPTYFTPTIRVMVMIIVASIACAYLFCVIIKGNQSVDCYVHGGSDCE